MTTAHWHVCATLAGYGPNGTIGDYLIALIAADPHSLCCLIHAELISVADHAHEMVCLFGAQARELDGQGRESDATVLYRTAYDWFELSERLNVLVMTFDPERASSPLYRRDKPAWDETILKLVDRHMPCPIDPDGNELLYVWTCGEAECREDS